MKELELHFHFTFIFVEIEAKLNRVESFRVVDVEFKLIGPNIYSLGETKYGCIFFVKNFKHFFQREFFRIS